MYTFQDFQNERSVESGVARAISEHRASIPFRDALDANEYDRQRNTTITRFTKMIYSSNGLKAYDSTASSSKIASNFFARLNTQRCTYSMGNGITFDVDGVKEKLGQDFDTRMRTAVYDALIHGVSFIFWNVDHIHVFPLTEFAPLWDEETGSLRAGVRFWQIDRNKPMVAILYEEDGYTRFQGNNSGSDLRATDEKRSYRVSTVKAPADDEPEVILTENYSSLPIIPMYGSRLHQSTLVGLKSKIDAYDLVSSGFCDDLQSCSEVFFLVSNAGGMSDQDLDRFRDRLKLTHIANVNNADDVSITPYTQEIPTAARQTFLSEIRSSIYEDFGGLDVHAVQAGATNDHVEAAYQPMDENADDLEYQVIDAVQGILALQNIEATPQFKRNRISNQTELTNMILSAANYLDDETILNHLPFLSPEEVATILERKAEEDLTRLADLKTEEDETDDEDNAGDDVNDGTEDDQ